MTKSVFSGRYGRFRRLVIEARKSAGVTQAALALRLGRPQSYVSKYERGERRLDVIEFLEIASALRVRPEGIIQRLQPARSRRQKDSR